MVKGRCISCDEPVIWAQMLRSRKWIPLDPDRWEDGNLEIVEVVKDGTPIVRIVPLVERDGRLDLCRTHFATCPQADRHRRRS